MNQTHFTGLIEVVCGPMFAGKTEELIRRARRLKYANKKYQVFKPIIDNRYTQEAVIISHNLLSENAILVSSSQEILDNLQSDTQAVIIDEAQFFDQSIVSIANKLADQGLRVIIGGLDTDFRGEPFGPMPFLLAIAEKVDKLSAICVITGENATRTQRLIDGRPANYDDEQILVGAKESYEPRSRFAHKVIKTDE